MVIALIILVLLAVVCNYLLMGYMLLRKTKVKPRFSLQSLMFFVLWGGACASLLHDPERELLFAYGVVGIILFFAFFVSYIITTVETAETTE